MLENNAHGENYGKYGKEFQPSGLMLIFSHKLQ